MLSAERRWAYYYDFNLKSYPEEAPIFDLEDVLDRVKIFWKNGIAVHQYRNEEVTVRIKDITMTAGDDFATILINVSDVKATDPAFSNIKTGDVRKELKKEDEGIGAACHVLFSRKCFNNKPGWYLAMIEEVTGVPKSTIEQFLTYIFKISCTSNFKKMGAKSKKPTMYRPMAEFRGHGSETLVKSLKDNVLHGITLLNHDDNQFIDDNKSLRMTEQVMKIRATDQPKGNLAMQAIMKAKEYGTKHNYNEVRVQYTEVVAEEKVKNSKGEVKNRQVKKQRTVNFDTRAEDFANLVFTKSELIELKNEIGQCEEKIHVELNNNMKKLLRVIVK
jgi:hypothetical protein